VPEQCPQSCPHFSVAWFCHAGAAFLIFLLWNELDESKNSDFLTTWLWLQFVAESTGNKLTRITTWPYPKIT
jgi:hypothetical protein